MPLQRVITLEELSTHFGLPEKMVAKKLGICLTSLKKLCRQHGIHRWPYRKLKSIEKKVEKLESLMRTPTEDVSGVRAKIQALNEEKKRLPFTGTPSCAYGGVRRAPTHAGALFCEATVPLARVSSSASWTSSSPSEAASVSPEGTTVACGSAPQLAERLRAVGSLETHKQRLVGAIPSDQQPVKHIPTEFDCDASLSGSEDLFEQPDDDLQECLLYGEVPQEEILYDMSAMPMADDFSSMHETANCCAPIGMAEDVFGNTAMDSILHEDDFFSATAF
jgi:hypothetical protein